MFKVASFPLSSSISGGQVWAFCWFSLTLAAGWGALFSFASTGFSPCSEVWLLLLQCNFTSSERHWHFLSHSLWVRKPVYPLLRTLPSSLLRFCSRKDWVKLSVPTNPWEPEMWKGIVLRSGMIVSVTFESSSQGSCSFHGPPRIYLA